MLSAGLKKIRWLIFVSLASGCGSQSKSPEPGTDSNPDPDPDPALVQSENAAAAPVTVTADAWSAKRTFGVRWSWGSPLKAETLVDATFSLVTPEGKIPESVTYIQIDPWMPSMGHGTSTADQEIVAVVDRPGSYTVRGIYFIMGGPWEIRLTATVNGSKDRAFVKVQVE